MLKQCFLCSNASNKDQYNPYNCTDILIWINKIHLKLFNYKLVYNLKDFFKYIEIKNLEGQVYIAGTTYGFLPEILNNYKVKHVLQTKKIIENQNIFKSQNIELEKRISMDSNIKAILLADVTSVDEKLKNLMNDNWKIEKKFFNTKFRSTLYLLTR